MKYVLVSMLAMSVFALIGCGSSSPKDEGTIKPGSGVAQNPGGKPQSPEQAAYAAQMQKTGDAMNAANMKAASAMAAAQARTGGK